MDESEEAAPKIAALANNPAGDEFTEGFDSEVDKAEAV
jgi:hypothetical protein